MSGATSTYQLLVHLRPDTSLLNFQENVQKHLSGLTIVPTEFEVRSLNDYTKEAMANRRLSFQLLGAFAALGIIVSGLGVYATATLMAASQKKEMGIRKAIGAQTRDILWLSFWRGIRAILVGIPFGLLLSWILSKVLSSYLVQININDSLAWVISCVMLIVITIVAALIPALRVSRVNPIDTLRN